MKFEEESLGTVVPYLSTGSCSIPPLIRNVLNVLGKLVPNGTSGGSMSSLLGLGGFSTMNIRRWLPITSIIGDSLDQLDVYRTRVTSDELSSSAGVEKEYGPHGPRHTS